MEIKDIVASVNIPIEEDFVVEDCLYSVKILQLLKSDKIYFRFPGAGFMNYSEFLENERDNERRRLARLARTNIKRI
jgi:hypothetical protein